MSEWISVNDAMPEFEQMCLILTESGDIITGWRQNLKPGDVCWCFGHKCVSWDYEFNYDSGSVTHWMNIPEPPNGQQ